MYLLVDMPEFGIGFGGCLLVILLIGKLLKYAGILKSLLDRAPYFQKRGNPAPFLIYLPGLQAIVPEIRSSHLLGQFCKPIPFPGDVKAASRAWSFVQEVPSSEAPILPFS
jgi:hypothetical protein